MELKKNNINIKIVMINTMLRHKQKSIDCLVILKIKYNFIEAKGTPKQFDSGGEIQI